VRIEYRLTAKGEALASVVAATSAWAEAWLLPQPAGAPLTPATPLPAGR